MGYIIGAVIVVTFGLICKYSADYFASYMAQIDKMYGRMDNDTFMKLNQFDGTYMEHSARN